MPAGRYSSPQAFEFALGSRLSTIAQSARLGISDVRREIAYDRFVARLAAAAPGEWLLKGGVALALRFDLGNARRTRDVDVETTKQHDFAGARELIARAVAFKTNDDYFKFVVTKEPTGPIAQGITAYRFSIEAQLNGRTFERFVCDVGLGEQVVGKPERVSGRPLLTFAGIDPAEVDAVPIVRHVADKVHAYCRDHGGVQSSRTKDLVDLSLVSTFRTVGNAGELRAAISEVFKAHGEVQPQRMPLPPSTWRDVYAGVADGLAIPQDVESAYMQLRGFLDPILSGGARDSAAWDPHSQQWAEEQEMRMERAPMRRQGRERAFER